MASFTGTKIKDTYKSILKVSDNGELEAAEQEITDGAGNGTGVSLNTSGDVTATGTVSFGSLKDSGENITITKFVDEADGISANDNDSSIPTSAAVKDYVDNNITAQDLDITDGTNIGSVDLDSQSLTFTGDAGVTATVSGQTLTLDSSALQAQITSNDSDISGLDTRLTTAESNISSNDTDIAALQAADTTLQSNIDAEETARISADSTLQSNITSEASTRAAADTTLQSNIDAEASTRSSADTTLQSNIDAEASTRSSADTALQTQITSNDGDITALDGRLTTAEGNITSNDSDIATLQSDKYDKTGGAISGSVTIGGDLTVNGTTTTVNTQTLSVEDPLIELANQNAANTIDTGFYADYSLDAGVTTKYAGLFKDASDSDKFKLFKGLEVEPTTTVNTAGTGYAKGDLVVNDLDAVTVGGTLSTAAQPNITSVGTLSSLAVSGNLTVDTNTLYVDSANNRVSIGNASPTATLEVQATTPTFRLSGDGANAAGTTLGEIQFFNRDSSTVGPNIASNIKAISGQSTGAGSHLIFGTTTGSEAEGTSAIERMRIDSSGNVGIGTSSPDSVGNYSILTIAGKSTTAGGRIHLQTSDNSNEFYMYNAVGVGTVLTTQQSDDLIFGTNTVERLRITSAGNVGIGGTTQSVNWADSPTVTIEGASPLINLVDTTAGSDRYNILNNDGNFRIFNDTDGRFDFNIDGNGNIGIGTSSPSATTEILKGSEGLYLKIGGDNASNNRALEFTSSTSSGGSNGALHTINSRSISGEIALATGGSERMRIDSSGNVQIGSGTRYGKFDILDVGGSGANFIVSTGANGDNYFTSGNSGVQVFRSGFSERMRIDSSGNLGLGSSNPQSLLHVSAPKPTYTDSGVVFRGGTTNNNSHSGISLISSGNALGGQIGSNYLVDGVTVSQTNTGRSSAYIQMSNTTAVGETSAISFGGLVKGTTTKVERMRITGNGFVGIGESNPLVPLHISKDSASGENIALVLDNNNTTANNEVGLLFRGSVGSTNTDFQIATINKSANNADLVFRSDGTVERMRIDSSGNVGINNSNPTHALHIAGTDKGIRMDAGYLEIAYGASAYFSRFKTEYNFPYVDTMLQSVAGASYEGRIIFQTSSNAGALATRATIDNSGYLRLAGGGIQFNGDTAAANALDDYEEGTFTPVLADAATGGNTASGTFDASYTKIGRLVNVTLELNNIDTTGMTSGNTLYIRNLPFTVTGDNGYGTVSAHGISFVNANFSYMVAQAAGATNYILVRQIGGGQGDFSMTVAQIDGAGSDMYITVSYTV